MNFYNSAGITIQVQSCEVRFEMTCYRSRT